MAHTEQIRDRLAEAIRDVGSVASLPSTPDGLLDSTGPVGALLAAGETAAAAGLSEQAQDLLLDAPADTGDVATALYLFALMRLNDSEFAGHDIDGLAFERLDFTSLPAPSHLTDLTLQTTPDGGLRPVSTRSDERAFANISCEIQVLGPNDGAHTDRVGPRALDDEGLDGEAVRLSYHQRLTRRLLWGFAQCVFSNQRMFGVVFQRDDDRPQRTDERRAMPDAGIFQAEGRPVGSVVMFSIDRGLLDEHAVQAPLLSRRLPVVVFTGGAIDVVLHSQGAEDEAGHVGRPAKGQIATAVDRFWSVDAAPRGRPDHGVPG